MQNISFEDLINICKTTPFEELLNKLYELGFKAEDYELIPDDLTIRRHFITKDRRFTATINWHVDEAYLTPKTILTSISILDTNTDESIHVSERDVEIN